jgi:hypothetical protein
MDEGSILDVGIPLRHSSPTIVDKPLIDRLEVTFVDQDAKTVDYRPQVVAYLGPQSCNDL